MPRLSNEVQIHLNKAVECSLLAVETYNRPRTSFKSGGFIVLMCIAWTSFFHAVFFRRGVKPFYRQRAHKGRIEMVDGDRKAWELSTCLTKFFGTDVGGVRRNVEFFVRLRNKIEHRSMPGLDDTIFGECQAMLFNFESLLVREFGDKYALYESLSFSLQFSIQRNASQERSRRRLRETVAKDVRAYVEEFRSSLSTDQLNDLQFSYKVFLIPKIANHERSADLAIEFVRPDPDNPEQTERIERAIALIKPTSVTIQGSAAINISSVPSVRLTRDPSAPAVRGVSAADICRMRQSDLLRKVIEMLGSSVRVTTHDLQCVRKFHHVEEHAEWFWKPQYSPGQYSEEYAHWMVNQFRRDPNFFLEARRRHQQAR